MFEVVKTIKKHTEKNIILACSWGPDSIFLLYEIAKSDLKDNLTVCYFNHKLRAEAESEAEYIRDLCNQNSIKFELWEADIKKEMEEWISVSMEEIAREKRYEFLRNLKEKHNADYIITGHHLDDRIETLFFNMARGSKLTGLINMTEISWDILRPLIHTEKNVILTYLKENNLQYFEDKSNQDNTITRNKLRNEILPNFEDINSRYKQNINNLLKYFEDVKDMIDFEVKNFLWDKNYFIIEEFQSLPYLMQNEVIRYIYFISNEKSTIWLSEKNIAEIIKFIGWKNNKTKKEIRKMSLFKENKKILWK